MLKRAIDPLATDEPYEALDKKRPEVGPAWHMRSALAGIRSDPSRRRTRPLSAHHLREYWLSVVV